MADHLLVLLEDVLSSDTGLNDSMVDVVQSLRRPGWYEDVGVDGLRQLVQMVQQRELGNASRISLNTIKARALGCNSREVEHAATKQDNDRARRNAKQLRRRHRDALAGAWNAGATARALSARGRGKAAAPRAGAWDKSGSHGQCLEGGARGSSYSTVAVSGGIYRRTLFRTGMGTGQQRQREKLQRKQQTPRQRKKL